MSGNDSMVRYIFIGKLLEKSQPDRYNRCVELAGVPMNEDIAAAYVAMYFEKSDPQGYAEFTAEVSRILHSMS